MATVTQTRNADGSVTLSNNGATSALVTITSGPAPANCDDTCIIPANGSLIFPDWSQDETVCFSCTSECVEGSTSATVLSPTAADVEFTFPMPQPGRICFWKTSDPSTVWETLAETSSDYSTHVQALRDENAPSGDFLEPGTSYTYFTKTLDDNGEWVRYSCDEELVTDDCVDGETSITEVGTTTMELTFFTGGANQFARICYYATANPANIQYTTPDLSGQFGGPGTPHVMTVTGLSPDTSYTFYTQIPDPNDPTNDESWVIHGCAIVGTTLPGVVVTQKSGFSAIDARDQFWAQQGFEKEWGSFPDNSDLDPNTAQNYTSGKFANGPWSLYNPEFNASADVILAPDGSPAVHVTLRPNPGGKNSCFQMRGAQLGLNTDTRDKEHVFQLEWWNPCPPELGHGHAGDTTPRRGVYIGMGYMWGSAPGITDIPGGSTRYWPNRQWSLRYPIGPSGVYGYYGYFPDYPGSPATSNVPGESWNTQVFVPNSASSHCGRWELLEVLVRQNWPHTASNAVMDSWVNGVNQGILNLGTQRIVQDPDVSTRGFAIVAWDQHHNTSGYQSESNFYYRCSQIYSRKYR